MTIKKLSIIAAGMSIAVGMAASAFAVGPGGAVVVGPAPSPFGNWVGEYKYIWPHTSPDGMHHTYKYVQVMGSTKAYCEQQFPANVIITKDCILKK